MHYEWILFLLYKQAYGVIILYSLYLIYLMQTFTWKIKLPKTKSLNESYILEHLQTLKVNHFRATFKIKGETYPKLIVLITLFHQEI